MESVLNLGMDIGSTTIKVVVTDDHGIVLFKDYRRHYADIEKVIGSVFDTLIKKTGDQRVHFSLTGSAGMGVAERCGIGFIQEVVASCEVISSIYPDIRTLIDIGGEDAKMIFFSKKMSPDIRMNGSCAGGTGSFIDQISSLLNIEVNELNQLAENSSLIYPIASRCGVFCKTDIQNLLSRNVCKEDIAASVFHAVSLQVITSLARGHDIEPKIFVCGGPFTFIPALRNAFAKELKIDAKEIVLSEHSEVIPAWGAAVNASKWGETKTISEYMRLIQQSISIKLIYNTNRLPSLFKNETELIEWQNSKKQFQFQTVDISKTTTANCYIGIDSGSTTTKVVATDEAGRVFYHFYQRNNGNSLQTVAKGLDQLQSKAREANKHFTVLGSCVTGYGEDLVKAAFSIDAGMVETIAHYMAACRFNPKVSFILDIGGQDMKAAFIENGIIKRMEINEACSSGCGSFIETFAHSLNYTAAEFSQTAISSKNPCDLGTRCTVFMNSKVKQSLREGASIGDISAGLGYSVIKNCLNKVLKLKNFSELGDHIMVQGGTLRNTAVIRALELEIGKSVMITDYPELMGAYGAAIFARQEAEKVTTNPVKLADLSKPISYIEKVVLCKGCENQCTVTCYQFENTRRYFAGNKCEKVFCNTGEGSMKGRNLYAQKYNLLFERDNILSKRNLAIGIPRALGIYENYPFWHTLLSSSGFNVVLSDISTMKLYEKGLSTVMSDNICFPAKLANGHILNLIEKKVDRIFMPFVVYEGKEDDKSANSYNCPIVTAYSEVIKSAVNPAEKYGIPLDAPSFTFKDKDLMKKACAEYLRSLSPAISKKEIDQAFTAAIKSQNDYEKTLMKRCKLVIESASEENRLVVLLAGHPYHTDTLIQHKIADVIADFGVDVITEDVVRGGEHGHRVTLVSENVQSITQWAYTNRIMKAALWAAKAPDNVHYIELTSFGCGPDAFILDEVSDILRRNGKNATLLKVDDINNIGSTRLRIRSLIESLKFKQGIDKVKDKRPIHTPPFEKKDRHRKILMPWFGDFYSPFIPAFFGLLGYEAENLPPSDQQSAEYGLKYSNNEICYPATLVVGDFIKALNSGKYKREEIALGITQTGGQCRATNYIALLKKAMMSDGFEDIPVISVSIGSGTINEQPGFKIRWSKVFESALSCMVYADCLSQFYYATAPREVEKGTAEILKNKYILLGIQALSENNAEKFYHLAEKAAEAFERINTRKTIPRIGIVGEIYVKYNNFGNKNVINWLVAQGIEPIVPPITKFFTDGFASQDARVAGYVSKRSIPKIFLNSAEKYIFGIVRKMKSISSKFPYYRPTGTPRQDAERAAKIINLNAQFGEGWSIPAEFAQFAESGINNVISLQPFGCIANHIVSKGIEKRIRQLYPSMNILSLDFDSGMSEVNIYNRLHFMVKNAISDISECEANVA